MKAPSLYIIETARGARPKAFSSYALADNFRRERQSMFKAPLKIIKQTIFEEVLD